MDENNFDKKDERDFKANANIGRLALSKNICRFELPMDMRKLEGILFDIF